MKFLLITFLLISFQAFSQSTITADGLRQSLSEISIQNNGNLLPLQSLTNYNIAAVHLDDQHPKIFDSIAAKYWQLNSFSLAGETDSAWYVLHDQLKFYNCILFNIAPANINQRVFSFLQSLQRDTSRKVIVILHGQSTIPSEFASPGFPIVFASTENPSSASITAQAIFGGVSVAIQPASSGRKKNKIVQSAKMRLGYGVPAYVNMQPGFETKVDSIMKIAINQHVTPGAVVLFIRDGQVILDKAYGNHTYTGTEPTKSTDLFDMASVTKVTATTPTIMKLYERNELALDSPVSRYVEVLKMIPDKKDQTIKEALLHEAGYYPYIKFYEKLTPLDLSFRQSDSFPLAIAENYFLKHNYFDSVMWPVTLHSPVPSRGRFVYSDISMYMMKAVAENITHRPLDEYVLNEFYKPLGMWSSGFKPLLRFPKSRIVPTTENDNWLRNMNVTGYVNDPGAAMSGGVQGHAGLFSTANDLAIYYQMLLNGGSYGGMKYFEPSTVALFTSRQSKVSTRGLGFAKALEGQAGGAGQPSLEAYGHSGYTGTYVWVDPKFKIVYVCLTNRVYPDDGKTYGPAKFNLRAVLLEEFYRGL